MSLKLLTGHECGENRFNKVKKTENFYFWQEIEKELSRKLHGNHKSSTNDSNLQGGCYSLIQAQILEYWKY